MNTPELASFLSYMKKYKISIKYKDKSLLMKFLNIFVWLFNKKFMTTYTTAVGNTIYFPSKEFVDEHESRAINILAHELVHIDDRKRINKKYFPGAFFLAYFFPQILAVFSLLSFLAFININWLFCLLFLLFLAPIPAPGRCWIEARGYAMTMYYTSLEWFLYGRNYDHHSHAVMISSAFTGWGYYEMWPFENDVVKKLKDNYIHCLELSPVFQEVTDWFNDYYEGD